MSIDTHTDFERVTIFVLLHLIITDIHLRKGDLVEKPTKEIL